MVNIFDLINVFVQVILCPNRQEFDEKIIIEKKGNSKSNIGQIGDGKFLSIECFHVTTVLKLVSQFHCDVKIKQASPLITRGYGGQGPNVNKKVDGFKIRVTPA